MTGLTMKAMEYEKFGSPEVLKLKEIDKPKISEDEILTKNYATSVNTIDIVFRSRKKALFGLVRLTIGNRHPKRLLLGFNFARVIEELGFFSYPLILKTIAIILSQCKYQKITLMQIEYPIISLYKINFEEVIGELS